MQVDALLLHTVELMVIGMVSVFIILGLLIGCMNLLRLFAPTDKTTTASPAESALVIAAMQAAIHQYRRQRRAKQ